MRRIMPLVCTGMCCFGRFWSGNRCSGRARKGGPRGATKLAGRFITPNNIPLDKLPWFAMVLVAFGEYLALRNVFCVHRLAGGDTLFWSILERKSLFLPRGRRLRGALMTPGRFLTPNNIPSDKLHGLQPF